VVRLFLAEVVVGFVDPVLAGWGEDVEAVEVFNREGGVGDVGRNDEDLSGADGDGFAVEGELHGAGEAHGKLLVVVMVKWDDAAFEQLNAGDHGLSAEDEAAGEERVELLERDVGPGVDGGFGFGGHECLSGNLLFKVTLV
jgi:hypothetical protein